TTSPRDSASGLPISSVISSARSSLWACTRSNARRRMSLRVRGAVAAHSCWAATAASRARMPSAGVASAMDAIVSPVEGSCTSKVRPSSASVHCPPMKRPTGTRASRSCSLDASVLMIRLDSAEVALWVVLPAAIPDPPTGIAAGGLGTCAGEGCGDDVEALVQQAVADGQRRQESDDVAERTAGEHDDALGDGRLRDGGGEGGIRRSGSGVDELCGHHRAVPAYLADARVGGLDRA